MFLSERFCRLGADTPMNESETTADVVSSSHWRSRNVSTGNSSFIAIKTFFNKELGTRQRSISRMRSLCSSAATILFTPHRDVGPPYCFMTIGKGGQTASNCLTGFLAVQTRQISRRSGDPKTTFRHFRHTCTSVRHASISPFFRASPI